MSRLHFEEARTEEQFAALSLIHALGWRTTYTGAIPADFMAREITDERWVGQFRTDYETGRCHGLLLYREDTPVARLLCHLRPRPDRCRSPGRYGVQVQLPRI